jgi:hypothetical protein
MIDIFSTFLAPLEQELSEHSSYSVGKSHSIGHNSNYMERGILEGFGCNAGAVGDKESRSFHLSLGP